ncbi:MAG: helix-turn-helix transcriptional regulator [Lactobacillus sp.]|nr:helix-turn-helix transcriptional regulator [Lactobacillus sp.]
MADFYGVSVPYLQEVDETAVHNRLKELREQQGLTLDDIEAKAGITRGTYSNYENNKTEPKMKTWQNLADFYGVSVPYLQGYEQSTPHNRLKEIQGNVYSYYKNDDGTYVGILPVFDFEGQFYCIVDISRQTIITICKSKDEALKACESMKPVNLEIYLMED